MHKCVCTLKILFSNRSMYMNLLIHKQIIRCALQFIHNEQSL